MSIQAEEQIIGSLLIDNNSIESVYHDLSAEMFTSELYGRMYVEFQRSYDQGTSLSPVQLEQKIRSENIPTGMIMDVIRKCVSDTTTSTVIRGCADVVIADYKANELARMISSVKVTPNDYEECARELYEQLEYLLGKRQTKSKSLSQITKECKDKYFKPDRTSRLYLGFDMLDDLIGGAEGGDVIVVGARPGVGKSALVTQITTNLAKQGKRIGFYNLEMQEKQVYERFLVSQSGISMSRLRNADGFIGDEELRFAQANYDLERADNIVLTTGGGKSVSEIRAESRHMGYDVIIIDYLQLLKADTTYKGNRYAEVGAISKSIKSLAMELNIPIILLSQLNRVSEGKDTKEPTMSELRESGDIEQDASVIILLWNLSAEDRSKKGLKVDKNRQGNLGKVVLEFSGDYMKFRETNETVENATTWNKSKEETPFD